MSQKIISIAATNLTKIYARGNEEIISVNNVSFLINKGDFVSIIGPSGSGKTTLINLLGCLDNPSSGELFRADRPRRRAYDPRHSPGDQQQYHRHTH